MYFFSPTSFSIRIARAFRSFSATPWKVRGRATFSTASIVGIRLKDWKMKPMCFCRNRTSSFSFMRSMCWPAITISPLEGCSRPASMLSRVDLPEPEVPTIEQKSPRLIWKETPFSARTFWSPTW